MSPGERLRCPSCGALCGVRRGDGVIEVRRRGRLVAGIERGAAYCACGAAVAISERTAEVVFRALERSPEEAA